MTNKKYLKTSKVNLINYTISSTIVVLHQNNGIYKHSTLRNYKKQLKFMDNFKKNQMYFLEIYIFFKRNFKKTITILQMKYQSSINHFNLQNNRLVPFLIIHWQYFHFFIFDIRVHKNFKIKIEIRLKENLIGLGLNKSNIVINRQKYLNNYIMALFCKQDSITIRIFQLKFGKFQSKNFSFFLCFRKMWQINDQSEAIYTFEAHHELFLSSHFPNYLGFNLNQDDYYYQHFMELTRGHTLRWLLKNRKKRNFLPTDPMFRVIIKQIFQGMWDICQMTKYMPRLPITLQNIQIQNQGAKALFKNIWFLRVKNDTKESMNRIEAKLLENCGQLITSMLEIKRNELNKLDDFLQLKNLLEGLFQAEEDLRLFENKIIDDRLTFAQLACHDLFDEELLAQFDITEVANNYLEIFGKDDLK